MPKTKNRSIAQAELEVLGVMLEDSIAWHYSLSVGAAAGIASGTIYPVLAKLEKAGWLESRWDESAKGRQRRRLYRLTGLGQRCATEVSSEQRAADLLPKPRVRRRFGFTRPQEGWV